MDIKQILMLVAIGAGFAVGQMINNYFMMKEMKKRENRMVKNMIKALEKLEWRDDKE